MGDLTSDKIILCLKKNNYGCSITEMVNKINLSRSAVRICLAKLSGEKKIAYRNVGVAKVYFLMVNKK